MYVTNDGNDLFLDKFNNGPQEDATAFKSAIDKKMAYIFCKDNCIGLPHEQES